MLTILLEILVLLVVLSLAWWFVSSIPLPAAPHPLAWLRWLLYAILIIIAIVVLLKIVPLPGLSAAPYNNGRLMLVADTTPTPPLLILGNIVVEVVGLSVVIFATVAQLKQWGMSGNALTGSAFGFGLVFGIAYKYATATPTDFTGWFWACVFGLMAGYVATGAYKGIESASGKNEPADVLKAKRTFETIARAEANAKTQPK